ncbi:hypothetical protein Taro_050003 [Colocasia esculenta]|uniref:Uncharacterized protein n=1 Tax=Colocasia esculenta TaxID=4460 RepID=A0A843XCU1_COLES|nr:hypothetical protein [Colocasia esculenta]
MESRKTSALSTISERSRAELYTTSDRRGRPTPCVGPASNLRYRGRLYCQKTLESGRSSAGIAIS